MDTVQQLRLLQQAYDGGSYYDGEKDLHLHHIPPSMGQEDLQALADTGRSPNSMIRLGHDEVLADLHRLAGTWSLEEAADAFVAGLWSAPFYWRSALTGKLLAAAMPEHPFTPYSGSSNACTICGYHNWAVDTSLNWFQLMRAGTPLDGDPAGHVLALGDMAKEAARPIPTDYDRWTFRAVLTVLRNLPPKTRYSKARDALHREKLLPTKNKWVYGSLLEALGLIGVLATPEYPGMASAWTSYVQRDQRPNTRVEVQAPLAWWDSSVGLNEEVLERVFAGFDRSPVPLDARPEPIPALAETVTGALEKKSLPRASVPKAAPEAGKGPVQAGDVYAIRIREGVWVTAYCHGLRQVHTLQARMEFLDGVYDHMPASEELIFSYRGRTDRRWQHWSSSIDSTSWVRRIARNITAPATDAPEPDRIPGGGAKELKHLASWCFPEIG